MKRSTQQGFTLIELIMVIVILGILAATALPKFADLGKDARKAAINGVGGSLKSGIAITKSAYLAAGDNTAVAINGVTVAASTGLPAATSSGIGIAVDSSGFDVTYASGVATYVTENTPVASATCKVTYTASTGAVAILDSDCS